MISSAMLRELSLCLKLRLNTHIQDQGYANRMEEFSRKRLRRSTLYSSASLECGSVLGQTKKPPGNRAAFSFQGRIVPTEAKDSVKTFWTKSYEPKKQGVKQFLGNKCL
jgi:hypothetical protein